MTETNTPPNPAICSQGTQRDRTNLRRYQVSLLIWAVTLLAATFLIKTDRVTSEAAGIGLALLPSLLAFVPAMAFLRFLRAADSAAGDGACAGRRVHRLSGGPTA
jgi:hypothetical protein